MRANDVSAALIITHHGIKERDKRSFSGWVWSSGGGGGSRESWGKPERGNRGDKALLSVFSHLLAIPKFFCGNSSDLNNCPHLLELLPSFYPASVIVAAPRPGLLVYYVPSDNWSGLPSPTTLPGTPLITARGFVGGDRRSWAEEQLLEDDLLPPPVLLWHWARWWGDSYNHLLSSSPNQLSL